MTLTADELVEWISENLSAYERTEVKVGARVNTELEGSVGEVQRIVTIDGTDPGERFMVLEFSASAE